MVSRRMCPAPRGLAVQAETLIGQAKKGLITPSQLRRYVLEARTAIHTAEALRSAQLWTTTSICD